MDAISSKPSRPMELFMFPWIVLWALLSAAIFTLWRHEGWDVFWPHALANFIGLLIVRVSISLYLRWKSNPE